VFEIEYLLIALVTALVTGEASPFVPDLDATRIEPDLDRFADINRSGVKVGAHSNASQPIYPREKDIGEIKAMLGERQQMRTFFDHQRAYRLAVAGDLTLLVSVTSAQQLSIEVFEIARFR